MNPSVTQLALLGIDQDQSLSQGGSKTIKKHAKGKTLFDLIGGTGSFASIMKQKGALYSKEQGGNEKEGSINGQAGSIGGKEAIEGGLTEFKIGKNSISKKREKGGTGENLPLKGPMFHENDMKISPDVSSSKKIADAKTKADSPLGSLNQPELLGVESSIEQENIQNMAGLLEQQGKTVAGKSVSGQDNRFSIKKGVIGTGNAHTLPEHDGTSGKDEIDQDLRALPTGTMKEHNSIKKNVSGEAKVSLPGGDMEVHGSDKEQNSDVKGAGINTDLSGRKDHEILASKNDVHHMEAVRANIVSDNQSRKASENTQNDKVLPSDVLILEKPAEKGFHENVAGKTDSSLLTAQIDSSGLKGVGNSPVTNMNGNIVTPLNYQDVVDQIVDDASYMLKKGGGRVVITLEPPNLGTLNMDVRVQHDIVKMVLIADNNDVKQVLHSNLDQLKTALQEQGLRVDRVDVLVQDKSYDGNPGFQPGEGAQFERGRGRRDDAREDNPSHQTLTSEGSDLNEQHLGMISLFA